MLAITILVMHGDVFSCTFGRGNPRTEANIQALFFELSQCFTGDLLVDADKKIFDRFQQNNVRSQAFPDAAEFQSDNACADNAQAFGYGGKSLSACGVDDQAAVGRRR